MPRPTKRAECHPERITQGRGLCKACYVKEYKKTWRNPKRAICHPDQPHCSKGLCASCFKKKWRAENLERSRQIGWRYRQRNKEKIAAIQKVYYLNNTQKHKSYTRARTLLVKFGVTREFYDDLVKSQGGVCALCARPPKRLSLALDHDHENGAIRGALCHPCNKALGMLGDNVAGLWRALQYVAKTANAQEAM